MDRGGSDGGGSDSRALWVFGYGSLVWRPEFPHVTRHAGYIEHWSRRFWQGSTDHRGVPEEPGRVVTLVREQGAQCWGTAFLVAQEHRDAVLEQLDHRERGGFERSLVEVCLAGADAVRALMYVATEENENYLGPAPLVDIAEQVQRCHGPSGPNLEYVLRLAEALEAMGAHDDHVFELARLLR